MTRLPAAAKAIVGRHRADPTELHRTCRACGRPWPCDVRLLADAVGAVELAAPRAAVVSEVAAARQRIPVARSSRRSARQPVSAAS